MNGTAKSKDGSRNMVYLPASAALILLRYRLAVEGVARLEKECPVITYAMICFLQGFYLTFMRADTSSFWLAMSLNFATYAISQLMSTSSRS